MWPWAKTATSPSGGQRAGDHAVGARAGVRRASRRRASRRPTASSPAAARGSRASCGPRSRRSRPRPGRGRSRGRSRPAARSRSARARGEASTSANSRPASRSRSARGGRRGPRSVSGMSVRRRVLARSAPLRLAVADEDDLHPRAFRASASTASTWPAHRRRPAVQLDDERAAVAEHVVLPADRGPAVGRQRAQRQPGAARVLALHGGVGAARRGPSSRAPGGSRSRAAACTRRTSRISACVSGSEPAFGPG